MHVRTRLRGTAIVDTPKGILVTAGRHKVFLLPGGGASSHEGREKGTIRELHEETGLEAYDVKFLFKHRGKVHKSHGGGLFQDHHKVFLIQAHGHARPRHEIKYIDYYTPESNIRISGVTREIIERYYAYKKNPKNSKGIIDRILKWLTT